VTYDSDPIDWALVARHIDGEEMPSDGAELSALHASDPRFTAAIIALRSAKDRVSQHSLDIEWNREAAFAQLLKNDASRLNDRSPGRTPTRQRLGICFAVAGALMLIVGIFGRVQNVSTDRRSTHAYTTKAGEHRVVTLADGSRVSLAPASRLVVHESADTDGRTITLDGEAYFDVKPSASSPFIVVAADVTTRVLGTSFSVRHYPADSHVQIIVRDGKVAVRGHHTRPVTLVAGMMASVNDSSVTATTTDNADDRTAWARGRLVFTDTPVPAMLESVGRWYGYTFRLTDSVLARRHVTAAFATSTPQKTLVLLQEILDVDMTFDSTVVTLHPRRGSTPVSGRGVPRATFKSKAEAGK
jgi:transmembrane sensor